MDTEASSSRASERHPIEFTASGSEYFRIWIVNLLLIAVTLGVYLPWAKARKLRYFHRNTWIAGDALDFHGEPVKMLRGTLLAVALLAAYTVATEFSALAYPLAALAFVAIAPPLFQATMRFRLANTSWRGLRFRFVGSLGGAYAAISLPIALLLVPFTLLGAVTDGDPAARTGILKAVVAAVGLGTLVFLFALPYFMWRLKKYQHDNYVLGNIRTRLDGDVGVLYGIFIKTLAISFAALLLGAALASSFLLVAGNMGGEAIAVIAILLIAVALGPINLLVRNYLLVRLQNFWWSTTTARQLRFESRLSVRSFLLLQLKNLFLIVLTLGLYWPFAIVNVRRARLEAMTVVTYLSLDRNYRAGSSDDPGATGEMAGDLFGIDIGM